MATPKRAPPPPIPRRHPSRPSIHHTSSASFGGSSSTASDSPPLQHSYPSPPLSLLQSTSSAYDSPTHSPSADTVTTQRHPATSRWGGRPPSGLFLGPTTPARPGSPNAQPASPGIHFGPGSVGLGAAGVGLGHPRIDFKDWVKAGRDNPNGNGNGHSSGGGGGGYDDLLDEHGLPREYDHASGHYHNLAVPHGGPYDESHTARPSPQQSDVTTMATAPRSALDRGVGRHARATSLCAREAEMLT